MKTIIVVPTYNEAENIQILTERVTQSVPDVCLLLMDDKSPDGTAEKARALFGSDPRYAGHSVVVRDGVRGLGRAYVDGFQRALDAGYDRIIQMDADMSHDPAYLPAMLEASRDADLVIGSRYCTGGGVEDWPAHRLALSRFANWYVHVVARIPVADATAGFRCWSRQALERIEVSTVSSDGYSFQVEMAQRARIAGLKIVESPITFTDREHGQSKMSRKVLLESFWMPWKLRFKPWQPQAMGGITEKIRM